MTKKYFIKLTLLMLISGTIGAIATIGLIKLAESNFFDFGHVMSDFLNNHTIEMHILLFLVVMLPALYFNKKGRDVYKDSNMLSDEEIDVIEKKSSKYIDLSMMIVGIFMVLNFMIFGMFFMNSTDNKFVLIISFLVGSLTVMGVEMTTIKFIKKTDERLKGDPTSMKFAKDFLSSCDEAEQLKIYKSGYQAFQFSKNTALVFIILSILSNIVFEIGGLPVFISCSFLLIQMVSYNLYATRD